MHKLSGKKRLRTLPFVDKQNAHVLLLLLQNRDYDTAEFTAIGFVIENNLRGTEYIIYYYLLTYLSIHIALRPFCSIFVIISILCCI